MADIKNKLAIWWDILLYSGLGCFSYFFLLFYTDIPVRHQDSLLTLQAFLAVIVFFNGLGLSMRYVNRRLRNMFPIFLKSRKILILFLIVSAIFLFLSNYILLVSAKLLIGIHNPFALAYKGFRFFIIIWLIELIIVGQFMINRYHKNIISLYKRAKELEESSLQSRYLALQNQLNPHFLFNSLNTLVAEITYNPDNAIRFTRNLADTYRYILHCQDKPVVCLKDELDFVEKYLSLQRVRLGNCLFLKNNIDDDYMEAQLPPLTLQLLVENIIKHNIISLRKPMEIVLELEYTEDIMWIVISNPVRLKQGVSSSGKGLENLSLRYRLLCNREIRVEHSSDIFNVKVPLFYE